MAGTLMASPVLGLRASRAARSLTENMPRPEIETSSPFLRESMMVLITVSTACSAWTLVPPRTPWTASTMLALFIVCLVTLINGLGPAPPSSGWRDRASNRADNYIVSRFLSNGRGSIDATTDSRRNMSSNC